MIQLFGRCRSHLTIPLFLAGSGCTEADLTVFSAPEATAGSESGGARGSGGHDGSSGEGGLSTGGRAFESGGSDGSGGSAPIQPTVVFVLDDFEDGDQLANEPGGWWYAVNDGTGQQTWSVAQHLRCEFGNACLRTSGSGFTRWGATIGVDVDGGPLVAEGVTIVQFSARADPPREVYLHMIDGSGEHFTRSFHITTEWQQYSVRLDQAFLFVDDEIQQLDLATLHTLQWFFFMPEPFDFWLDDVLLLRED